MAARRFGGVPFVSVHSTLRTKANTSNAEELDCGSTISLTGGLPSDFGVFMVKSNFKESFHSECAKHQNAKSRLALRVIGKSSEHRVFQHGKPAAE